MESAGRSTKHRLPTAAETIEAIRAEVGDVFDLTDATIREKVYAIFTRRCPTAHLVRGEGKEKIPAPPAAFLAQKLRELRVEAREEGGRS